MKLTKAFGDGGSVSPGVLLISPDDMMIKNPSDTASVSPFLK